MKRFYNGEWHDICPKIDHDKIRIDAFSKINGICRIDQINTNEGAVVKTKLGHIGKVYFQSAPQKGKVVIDCGKYELLSYPFTLELISFF